MTTTDTKADTVAQLQEQIEQLKRQRDELLEANRRLERASLSIQEGHWELDCATMMHWASSNYYALLGYRPDEIDLSTMEKVREIVHPDDRAAGEEAARVNSLSATTYEIELRVRVKDGSYRWFRLHSSFECDVHGKPVRMAGSIQDIHKQKLAEDALKEVQARLERAIHGTQDGLWEADLEKRRMWLSPRLQELLGFEPGELSDDYGVLRERVHPDDLVVSDAATDGTLSGIPLDFECRMRTKTGEYRWFRMRGTPARNSSGVVHRVSGSLQDVTDARAARDALVQATEAAQAANRAKSEFLANVSHEIRTPMNGIIGMSNLLLDTPLDATQREFAQTIHTSASSLLNIINDILDFSKIEAGKLDIESLEMDLRETVEDVGSILGFQAAAKHLELIIDVDPTLPTRVIGDPHRIRQCLINLVGNAIKFTRTGEIVCRVMPAQRKEPAVRLLRFEVQDTGIGITPAALDSLFQPFVQADSSTTRHFGGTGLGLSIVRRLVEMMGGEVGAESTPNEGSTFWFELPLTPATRLVQPERTASVPQRILIADDNLTLLTSLRKQLAYVGHHVTVAPDAQTALLALHSPDKLDVVVIDAEMPGSGSKRLCEEIAADPLLSGTRLILMTSLQTPQNLQARGIQGSAAQLPKPVRLKDLLGILQRMRDQDVTSSPKGLPSTPSAAPVFMGRVLVVEDNVVNQKVAQRFLERMGCKVTLAENGEQGVKAWQNGEFDLVLMDVQMPVMDGYTAARQIRDLEGGRSRTPIIALTANAMTGQLERCVEAGMDGLLTKPLISAELEAVLQRFGCGAPRTAANA